MVGKWYRLGQLACAAQHALWMTYHVALGMLRFAVYDNRGRAREWPMHDVVLIGKGDVVVPGTVRFDPEQGIIECHPREDGALALGLLHDAGPAGHLSLRTCLLAPSPEPYVLSVELARHKIGQFLVKCEEWQMAYLGDGHPAIERWEDARLGFTRAMVATDPVTAHREGQASLVKAIDAAERLVMVHAEILLRRRYGERGAASTSLGCRVQPGRCTTGLQQLLSQQFGLVVLPLTWQMLCPRAGEYNWDRADAWMEWALDNRRRIVLGPLIDLEPGCLPDWTNQWSGDYLALRDAAYEHVERVVQRYGDSVGMWNLVNGMEAGAPPVTTEREMVDLVRTLSLLVRSANRGRRIVVEIARPWGHYRATSPEAPDPMSFIARLAQSGVRLDAVGIRLLMGGTTGTSTRDFMDICGMLDRLLTLEVPVLISACSVPDRTVEDGRGEWRSGWSAKAQSVWANLLPQICLARPYVESVIWGDLYDFDGIHPVGGGLVTAEGRGKPALQRLAMLRQRLSQPWTEVTTAADDTAS